MMKNLILFVVLLSVACGQKNSDKNADMSLKSDSGQIDNNKKKFDQNEDQKPNIKEDQDSVDTKKEQEHDKKDYDAIGFDLMKKERLGKLKLGLNASELIDILGEPTDTTQSELWEADDEYHQTYKYANLGIQLDMSGETNADKTVSMISIKSPCQYKTSKGIFIGSSYTDVEQAYKGYINPEYTTAGYIVAGSIYGGVIFSFRNKKVKSITIGASSE